MTITESNLWISVRNKLIRSHHTYFSGSTMRKTSASKYLAKLLGLEYPERGFYLSINMSPELRDTLKKLDGPYGAVFLKMLETRKQK
jgi:hypothetical protein